MAHFGMICLPDWGHIHSFIALAHALRERGHEATFFQFSDIESTLKQQGLRTVVIGEDIYGTGQIAQRHQDLGRLEGMEAIRNLLEHSRKFTESVCRDVPASAKSLAIDAFAVDHVAPAGGTVAEHLGLPFVTVCSATVLFRDAALPPPNLPWRYQPGWMARSRNALAYRFLDWVSRPGAKAVNEWRSRWGLPVQFKLEDTFSEIAVISQQPRAFELPYRHLPAYYHYTGPHRWPSAVAHIEFPWEKLTDEPMIYASLGTMQNRRADVFMAIAKACEGLGAQLVLNHMGALGDEDLKKLPAFVLPVNRAPQAELFRKTSLVITHGGLNTVLDALAEGVPLVAIPIAHDQPGNAERIRYTGVGEVVAWKGLTSERLRACVHQVMTDSRYRRAAGAMRESIAAAGGSRRAAEVMESVVDQYE